MTIWIDADSCPAAARKIIFLRAKTLSLPIIYVANREIKAEEEYSLFKMVLCPATDNAADDYIVENSKEGDLVITRDVPFASRLVEKNVCAVSDRGVIFTRDNITSLLSERELSLQMHNLGIATGGKAGGFGNKERHAFGAALDKVFYSYRITK